MQNDCNLWFVPLSSIDWMNIRHCKKSRTSRRLFQRMRKVLMSLLLIVPISSVVFRLPSHSRAVRDRQCHGAKPCLPLCVCPVPGLLPPSHVLRCLFQLHGPRYCYQTCFRALYERCHHLGNNIATRYVSQNATVYPCSSRDIRNDSNTQRLPTPCESQLDRCIL